MSNTKETVRFYDKDKGVVAEWEVGEYSTVGSINDEICYFTAPKGMRVTCFEDKGFGGSKGTVDGLGDGTLQAVIDETGRDYVFGKVSSVIIEKIPG